MSEPTHIGPTSMSYDVPVGQNGDPSAAAKHRQERARERKQKRWWRRLFSRLRDLIGRG